MKVRILTSIASATWSYAPGEIVDMPDQQAKIWIKSGLAAPVKEQGPETAMIEQPEVRTPRTGGGKRVN